MTPTYDERLRRVFADEAIRLLDAARADQPRAHHRNTKASDGLWTYAKAAATDELLAFVAKLKEELNA